MEVRDEINLMYEKTREVYSTLDTLLDAPNPMDKNLANLSTVISLIPKGATLKRLKSALDEGIANTKYPLGTEVADKWNGNDSPWIIVHYGNATKANGSVVNGVYLKRVRNNGTYVWASNNVTRYANSGIYAYLKSEDYLSKCSTEARTYATEIQNPTQVPPSAGNYVDACPSQFWLASCEQLYGDVSLWQVTKGAEGSAFDYFKTTASPTNNASSVRSTLNTDGTATQLYWTRSTNRGFNNGNTYIGFCMPDGSLVNSYNPSGNYGLCPFMFIEKGN